MFRKILSWQLLVKNNIIRKKISEYYNYHIIFLIIGSILCLFIFTVVNSYLMSTIAGKRIIREEKVFKADVRPEETTPQEITDHEVNHQASKKDGLFKQYDVKTKLFTETNYKDGKRTGLSKSYFKDGIIAEEMNWKKDKPDGINTLYYRSGKPMQEAFFKNGLRDGLEKTYYENGKIMVEESYAQGKRLYMKRYDPQGQLVYQEDYVKVETPPEAKK